MANTLLLRTSLSAAFNITMRKGYRVDTNDALPLPMASIVSAIVPVAKDCSDTGLEGFYRWKRLLVNICSNFNRIVIPVI